MPSGGWTSTCSRARWTMQVRGWAPAPSARICCSAATAISTWRPMLFWGWRQRRCGRSTWGRERESTITMTWRWLIFFERGALCHRSLTVAALLSLGLSLPAGQAASVSGALELTNSKDASVRKHKDYSGVVLWLEAVDRPAPASGAGKRVEMLQKDKHFVPHVLAIPVGATVDFPNIDPIFHNAFSNFSGQPFDVGLYPPGTSRSVTFKHPGIVRVFCNIHSAMSAIIAVLPTPWFTVTQVSGKYSIPNVPPGGYQLRMFHERE